MDGLDRRYAPRLQGGIKLAYRVVGSSVWFEPDPWMDFSLTGLRFQDVARLEEGDPLALRMRLPVDDGEHEATAHVVRVSTIAPEEAATVDLGPSPIEHATCEVAIEFDHIAPETVYAFALFTERIQDAALERHRSLALALAGASH
jgi:PilZ domain-containing protein